MGIVQSTAQPTLVIQARKNGQSVLAWALYLYILLFEYDRISNQVEAFLDFAQADNIMHDERLTS